MTAPACEALGRLLPGLWREHEAAEQRSLRALRHSAAHRAARREAVDADARREAVENLVLATVPVTLADAAAVLVVAVGKVAAGVDCDNAQLELEKAERGLRAAVLVLAAVAGVSPVDLGAAWFFRDDGLLAAAPGGDA